MDVEIMLFFGWFGDSVFSIFEFGFRGCWCCLPRAVPQRHGANPGRYEVSQVAPSLGRPPAVP